MTAHDMGGGGIGEGRGQHTLTIKTSIPFLGEGVGDGGWGGGFKVDIFNFSYILRHETLKIHRPVWMFIKNFLCFESISEHYKIVHE